MTSFALFRLPREEKFTLMVQKEGETENVLSFNELNGKSGFVIAPFDITDKTPLLLIHPDKTNVYASFTDIDEQLVNEINECSQNNRNGKSEYHGSVDERSRYGIDFRNFHSQLSEGLFRKIVLARQTEVIGETNAPFQ